jgi:hypothetical protein
MTPAPEPSTTVRRHIMPIRAWDGRPHRPKDRRPQRRLLALQLQAPLAPSVTVDGAGLGEDLAGAAIAVVNIPVEAILGCLPRRRVHRARLDVAQRLASLIAEAQ